MGEVSQCWEVINQCYKEVGQTYKSSGMQQDSDSGPQYTARTRGSRRLLERKHS